MIALFTISSISDVFAFNVNCTYIDRYDVKDNDDDDSKDYHDDDDDDRVSYQQNNVPELIYCGL